MATSDHAKAYNRRYYHEKIKADPERWAQLQQQRREQRIQVRLAQPEVYARQQKRKSELEAQRLTTDPECRRRKRNTQLKYKYGIGLVEREALLASQDGACAICKLKIKFGKTGRGVAVIDHCHTTGRIRGILCGSCNLNIGQFRDDPELLVLAAEYLLAAVSED